MKLIKRDPTLLPYAPTVFCPWYPTKELRFGVMLYPLKWKESVNPNPNDPKNDTLKTYADN